jgi:carbonic anhydrase
MARFHGLPDFPIVMIRDRLRLARSVAPQPIGDNSELALPPARGFAILTYMDARLDPAKYADLSQGDVHLIRKAGRQASDDAIRSLGSRTSNSRHVGRQPADR